MNSFNLTLHDGLHTFKTKAYVGLKPLKKRKRVSPVDWCG